MKSHAISNDDKIEKHELVSGKSRALRRLLVSRLNYSHNDEQFREIMDYVLTGLPRDLVEGRTKMQAFHNIPTNDRPRPDEDGSRRERRRYAETSTLLLGSILS